MPVVRWDGTATRSICSPAVTSATAGDGRASPRCSVELPENEYSRTFASTTVSSSLSVPTLFASESTETTNHPRDVNALDKTENVSLGWKNGFLGCKGSSPSAKVRRPSSAGGIPAQHGSTHLFSVRKDKAIRPQTASARSTFGGVFSCNPDARKKKSKDKPEKGGGGGAERSWKNESCDCEAMVGGRASLEVVLPLLEEGSGRGDGR